MSPLFKTVVLLICSNTFMTIAWYGHLKWFKDYGILFVIPICWLLALPEYIFQVPANRIGHDGGITSPQLKIIQETISIASFLVFNWLVLKEAVLPTDWIAYGLILAAVVAYAAPRIMAG